MPEKKTPDISRYTFNTAESIFKDFEPYHCGTPAITEGFIDFEFDPEKCDETNNFQSFEDNGYTKEVLTNKTIINIPNEYTEDSLTNRSRKRINNNYKSNGRVINGCKKGTVILGDHPNHSTLITSGPINTADEVIIEITGSGNDKKLQIGKDEFDLDYFQTKDRGLVFPERLGILLTGMGGGAGGGTWYDSDKSGKGAASYYCSGGSGGGGEIIWGVIDIANYEIEGATYNTNRNSFKELAKNSAYKLIATNASSKSEWANIVDVAKNELTRNWNSLMGQITDIKTKYCYIIANSDKIYAEYKSRYWEYLLYTKNNDQKKLLINFATIVPLININKALYDKMYKKLWSFAGTSIVADVFDTYSNIASLFNLSEDEFKDLCLALNKNYPTDLINGHGGINGGTYPIDNYLDQNHPQIGTNGIAGASLSLYKCIKLSFIKTGTTYTCYLTAGSIATAAGGEGGKSGHWQNVAKGGEGGAIEHDPTDNFIACTSIQGCPGIDASKNMPESSIPERSEYIQFLTDKTADKRFSYQIGPIAARSASIAIDPSARIPGGHSFGTGAYGDTVAGYGGGGCSNGINGSCNGGSSYWMIFYA